MTAGDCVRYVLDGPAGGDEVLQVARGGTPGRDEAAKLPGAEDPARSPPGAVIGSPGGPARATPEPLAVGGDAAVLAPLEGRGSTSGLDTGVRSGELVVLAVEVERRPA